MVSGVFQREFSTAPERHVVQKQLFYTRYNEHVRDMEDRRQEMGINMEKEMYSQDTKIKKESCNCELRALYFSQVIITVTKSRRIRWEGPMVIRQRREIHTGSRCAKHWERDRFEELARELGLSGKTVP